MKQNVQRFFSMVLTFCMLLSLAVFPTDIWSVSATGEQGGGTLAFGDPIGDNLITNGDFSDGVNGWGKTGTFNSGQASDIPEIGSDVNIGIAPNNQWGKYLYSETFNFEKDKLYRLTMWVKIVVRPGGSATFLGNDENGFGVYNKNDGDKFFNGYNSTFKTSTNNSAANNIPFYNFRYCLSPEDFLFDKWYFITQYYLPDSNFEGQLKFYHHGESIQLANVTLTEVQKPTITYSVNENTGGTLTATSDSTPVVSGDNLLPDTEVTFKAILKDGYKIEKWVIDGVETNGINRTYSTKVPYGDLDVKIFYTPAEYLEVISPNLIVNGDFSDGVNGWLNNISTVKTNVEIAEDVTANAGVSANSWTSKISSQPFYLEANKLYKLTMWVKVSRNKDATGNDVLEDTGFGIYDSGTFFNGNNSFKTKDTGKAKNDGTIYYAFSNWITNEPDRTADAESEWGFVTQYYALDRDFEGELGIYHHGAAIYLADVKLVELQGPQITYSVDGENGTISASTAGGPINSGDVRAIGTNITFTATPNPGYRVVKWTVEENDGVNAPTVTTTNNSSLTHDVTVGGFLDVKVTFAEINDGDEISGNLIVNGDFSSTNIVNQTTVAADWISTGGNTAITVAKDVYVLEIGETVNIATGTPQWNRRISSPKFNIQGGKYYKLTMWAKVARHDDTGNDVLADAGVGIYNSELEANAFVDGSTAYTTNTAGLADTDKTKHYSFKNWLSYESNPTVPEKPNSEWGFVEQTYAPHASFTGELRVYYHGASVEVADVKLVEIQGPQRYLINFGAKDNQGGTVTAIAMNDGNKAIVSGSAHDPGLELRFTATPETGWAISKWFVDGEEIDNTLATYAATLAKKDINIEVEFIQLTPAKITYSVAVGGEEMGSLTATADGVDFNSGDDIVKNSKLVFTAAINNPATHEVSHWIVNEKTVDSTSLKYAATHTDVLDVQVVFREISNERPTYTTLKEYLGINVAGGIYVDLMKNSRAWATPNDQNTLLAAGETDENGWPLVDATNMVSGGAPYDGIYTLIFDGKATIENHHWGYKVDIKSTDVTGNDTNGYKTTVELEYTKGSNIGWKFTNTENPDSTNSSRKGISNVKLICPGYTVDDIFVDEYIETLEPFSVLRLMDFTSTNGDRMGNEKTLGDHTTVIPETWADRTTPDNYSQNVTRGNAWEYAIELANITRKDIWINVPATADDDYVTKLATMMKENLKPNIHIYVEWSNEIWNNAYAFYQAKIADAMAKKFPDITKREQMFARRSAEIAHIFGDVFGENSLAGEGNPDGRIKMVLTWQEGSEFIKTMMDYLNNNTDSKYHNANKYIYASSVAPYFSEPSAIYATDIDYIHRYMRYSIESKENTIKALVKNTKELGLVGGVVAYEGGPHYVGDGNANLNIRTAAQKDPLMTELIQYYIVNFWYNLDANLFMYYKHHGASSQYGYWGALDTIYSDPLTSPKYNALVGISRMSKEEGSGGKRFEPVPVPNTVPESPYVNQIKNESFEGEDPDNEWILGDGWSIDRYESIDGYNSLKATGNAPGEANTEIMLTANKDYILSFWHKGETGYKIAIDLGGELATVTTNQTDEWTEYLVPFRTGSTVTGDIKITNETGNTGPAWFDFLFIDDNCIENGSFEFGNSPWSGFNAQYFNIVDKNDTNAEVFHGDKSLRLTTQNTTGWRQFNSGTIEMRNNHEYRFIFYSKGDGIFDVRLLNNDSDRTADGAIITETVKSEDSWKKYEKVFNANQMIGQHGGTVKSRLKTAINNKHNTEYIDNFMLFLAREPNPVERKTISFDTNGGTPETIARVENIPVGDVIPVEMCPAEPTKEDYVFDGWFIGDSEEEFIFGTTVVNEDITLTAKWVVYQPDVDCEIISVIKDDNNTLAVTVTIGKDYVGTGVLLVGIYDNSGVLVELLKNPIIDNQTEYSFDISGVPGENNITVFLWSSVEDMVPLSGVKNLVK